MGARNSAKAIIIDGNKILLNKCQSPPDGLAAGAVYYCLPGGGQNRYETLEEAVVRECIEETGYTVSPVRLAAVYEEIVTNEKFRLKHAEYAHKVYFIFVCRLADAQAQPPTEIDLDMLCSEWINLDELDSIPMYPAAVRANIKAMIEQKTVLYFGADRIGAPA